MLMEQIGRRVRFTADFAYKPKPSVTIVYPAGTTAYVRRDCAQKAVAAGKAEALDIPSMPSGIKSKINGIAGKIQRKRRGRK